MDTTATASRRLAVAQLAPTLRLLHAGGDGTAGLDTPALGLRPGEYPVGRAPDGAVDLSGDRQASRRHAVISVAGGGPPMLRDCGSKNGTFLNGRRATTEALCDGDVVRVGDSFLLVRYEASASPAPDPPVAGLLGVSPAARALRRELHLLGPAAAPVLLLGESGSGKEVAAQALHRLSPRAQRPLVVLDCGAVTRSLIEADLFGHEQGAFTGAERRRLGLFEQAHGGTLFIDELGTLPPEVQPALLRALEGGVIRRAGGQAPIAVDVRVIAATNEDLEERVRAGSFRGDLYARLARVVLHLPPLRDRREDILPILADRLRQAGAGPRALDPDLVEALLLHDWPLNIRELGNVATELALRGAGSPRLERRMVRAGLWSGPPAARPAAGGAPAGGKLPAPGREELVAALRQSGGNISELARRWGCSRRTVHRWLEQHGVAVDPRG